MLHSFLFPGLTPSPTIWAQRLLPGRKGTRWDWVLQTLCAYRLISPGSEWRLHRHWFE